ncbi:hypothetical protein Hamer_G004923 [Homarus americanus]|uniref:Uncharacterized protein n=1 Tax=Homarus americanus TaxID=6706 RepID=A0A8J5MW13_HOMAM|nr:hypothetical protein Hamer_G004923 [Homarus americanus]
MAYRRSPQQRPWEVVRCGVVWLVLASLPRPHLPLPSNLVSTTSSGPSQKTRLEALVQQVPTVLPGHGARHVVFYREPLLSEPSDLYRPQ